MLHSVTAKAALEPPSLEVAQSNPLRWQRRETGKDQPGMDSENLVPLTLEEHRELGREMKQTAKRLRVLCALVVDMYGPQSRASFSFLRTMEELDRLNQELQTQAMRDLPGYPSNDLYL
jgi:hypothetical protein